MENEKHFYPSPGAKIFLSFTWIALFGISIYAYIVQSSSLIFPLAAGLALIIFVMWIRGVSITTSFEGVTVGSGFGRLLNLAWSDIGEVTTTTKVYSTGKTVSAKYQTTLVSNQPSKKDMRINIKLYGRKDLAEFASILLERAKGAKIDDATKAMSEGRMPSAFGFGRAVRKH